MYLPIKLYKLYNALYSDFLINLEVAKYIFYIIARDVI